MRKVTSLLMITVLFGTLLLSNKVQAQMPGSVAPIVLLKLATGYWGDDDDSDGDGVKDDVDPCPEKYGKMNGCPWSDKDGDGLSDIEDDCPEIAGTTEHKGCPDTDGDGVADSKDACPKVKGSVDLGGCPDTDGDGIADKDDPCPKVKGLKEHNGCPDTDGDGIPDKDDECPTIKGSKALKGCAEKDSDGDGVPDSKDLCPNLKGLKENNGCLLSKEEKDIIKEASANIYFQTGSSKIKQESYKDLDRLTAILKKHPEVKATVEGHTDSSGNANSNLKLSKSRAASVKKYLIEHGEKADHISSEGYGSAQPIAPNETKEGRAKNRRVQIVISAFHE